MRLTARSRIFATLAVALTAAALAPGASADHGVTQHQPVRLRQQSGHSTNSTTGVRPNPDQQSTQSGSVGPPILPVARAAETAAIARAEAQRKAAHSYSLPDGARYSSAAFNAYAALTHPVAASTPTVKVTGDGFDYGAAGVGAGLTATILAVFTVGGLVVRRHRGPQYG